MGFRNGRGHCDFVCHPIHPLAHRWNVVAALSFPLWEEVLNHSKGSQEHWSKQRVITRLKVRFNQDNCFRGFPYCSRTMGKQVNPVICERNSFPLWPDAKNFPVNAYLLKRLHSVFGLTLLIRYLHVSEYLMKVSETEMLYRLFSKPAESETSEWEFPLFSQKWTRVNYTLQRTSHTQVCTNGSRQFFLTHGCT